MDIELLGDLLYGPAGVLYGSTLADEQLVQISTEVFGAQTFCIVRNWMLINVMLSDAHDQMIKKQGLQPTILYAQTIVSGGDATGEISHGALSSFQRRYDGCFFVSKDMLYILGGRGAHKYASVPAVSALARRCGGEFMEAYEQRSLATFA